LHEPGGLIGSGVRAERPGAESRKTCVKILTLVRHAKSSWKHPELTDRRRPLNKRGERDAPEMGRRLAGRGEAPDLIVSSPAVRALTTARTIARAVGHAEDEIVLVESVYHADAEDLLEFVRGLADSYDHVMLFGHNPALTDLVNRLAAEPLDNVPTCGVVRLEHPGATWDGFGRSGPLAMSFDWPKNRR
jgi:phosphohistidine phosphatase